jgi:hypothetical protein
MTTISTGRSRPWRRRRIAPSRPDIVVAAETPLAELRIYESLVLLTRREGASWRQYPIDPDELAQLLGRVPSVSGLLPANTLGTGLIGGAPFYVVYVPARRARIQTMAKLYEIPLPPLLWCGWRREYRIWALDSSDVPTRDVPLWRAPFPNCYEHGGICWGNVSGLSEASPKTLAAVLTLFLEESAFNMHVAGGKSVAYPVSVISAWAALEERGDDAYPLTDLMPAEASLGWVLSGGPWGAGGRRR